MSGDKVSFGDVAAEYEASGGDATPPVRRSVRWYYRTGDLAGRTWEGQLDFDDPVDFATAEHVVRERVGKTRMHNLALWPAGAVT